MVSKKETWKKYGEVRVTRDEKGRFVHWLKVIPRAFNTKSVAVYGYVLSKGRVESRRAQVFGRGRDLRIVMPLLIRHPPKSRFLTIKAERLSATPYRYLDMEARWVDRPEAES